MVSRSWSQNPTKDSGTSRLPTPSAETARLDEIVAIAPAAACALEIGARDGRMTRRLVTRYPRLVALDLQRPAFDIPGVETVAGDVRSLQFADASFDVVFCTEVLEHVPEVSRAALELTRVSRRYIVIGVPFEQDLRVGMTVCPQCGRRNPPWGHVNSFRLNDLFALFPQCIAETVRYVGSTSERTNTLSSALMRWAGDPWGTYDQEEPCIYCGVPLRAPGSRNIAQRMCSFMAVTLDSVQRSLSRSRPGWVHLVFRKTGPRHPATESVPPSFAL